MFSDTFVERSKELIGYETPGVREMNTLSSVSAFYLYTNPAPKGYGTPAPKVAETVLRADSFNLKPLETRMKKIGEFEVNWNAWEDPDANYPFDEITGNFHPGAACRMFKKQLKENFKDITTLAKRVINESLNTNSDVLTKGRQTFHCIKEVSVASSTAYQVMAEIYKMNLKKDSSNCLEWIQMFMELMSLKEMVTLERVKEVVAIRYRTCKYTKIRRKVISYRYKWRKTKIIGEEKVRNYVFQLSTTFCGYIKHGERSKLERRAIASPNIIKRMFLKIIEDFHLLLGKRLPGSTISIGGEEKKITANTNQDNTSMSNKHFVIQATQDATKFNECMSPDVMLMMHRVFFDPEIREEMKLPEPTVEEELFLLIASSSHWILTTKKILLGEGIMGYTDKYYNRIPWEAKNVKQLYQRMVPKGLAFQMWEISEIITGYADGYA